MADMVGATAGEARVVEEKAAELLCGVELSSAVLDTGDEEWVVAEDAFAGFDCWLGSSSFISVTAPCAKAVTAKVSREG